MLEKICTNLETSKKLKELGIKMETYFQWTLKKNYINSKISDLPVDPADTFIEYKEDLYSSEEVVEITKAYTLEQILAMFIDDGKIDICISKTGYVGINFDEKTSFFLQEGDNIATTAARLLIKLIEDKVITNPNNKESDE